MAYLTQCFTVPAPSDGTEYPTILGNHGKNGSFFAFAIPVRWLLLAYTLLGGEDIGHGGGRTEMHLCQMRNWICATVRVCLGVPRPQLLRSVDIHRAFRISS